MSKLPEPKDWWRSRINDDVAFICGFDFEGCPVFQTDEISPARIDTMEGFLKDWYFEPRCMGFNKVKVPGCADIQDGPIVLSDKQLDKLKVVLGEPVKPVIEPDKINPLSWPKYFVPVNPDHDVIIGHYYRIDTSEIGWCVDRGFDSYRINCKEIMSNPDLWKEVTEAEVKAIKPVYNPDNRPARDVIMDIVDWLDKTNCDGDVAGVALKIAQRWLKDNQIDPSPFAKPFTNPRSGMGIRKDLPALLGWPEQFAAVTTAIRAAKSIPLKLWTTYRILDEGGDWPVRATNANDTCQNWIEVKIGPNGFYTDAK